MLSVGSRSAARIRLDGLRGDALAKYKDYYEVLGVAPRSHARVIEEKYWEQAHELHKEPTKKAQKRLTLINEAYETLGTPHRRDKYDQERRYLAGAPPEQTRPNFLQMFVHLLAKPFRPD